MDGCDVIKITTSEVNFNMSHLKCDYSMSQTIKSIFRSLTHTFLRFSGSYSAFILRGYLESLFGKKGILEIFLGNMGA